MDGLENDRNPVVQALACVAALPLGIWEQTIGAVTKSSEERTERLVAALNEVADTERFERRVANDVARCLQSQSVHPVTRWGDRVPLPAPVPSRTGGTEPNRPDAAAECGTALEIQAIRTELIGKHAGSRSRALSVEIQATVIRTSDGQELYSCPIRYRSLPRKLKDWVASDAKPLRQELDECSRQTAQAVAREVIARAD
jgi:hypothetical protein